MNRRDPPGREPGKGAGRAGLGLLHPTFWAEVTGSLCFPRTTGRAPPCLQMPSCRDRGESARFPLVAKGLVVGRFCLGCGGYAGGDAWQLAQRTFSVLVILIVSFFRPHLQGARPGHRGVPGCGSSSSLAPQGQWGLKRCQPPFPKSSPRLWTCQPRGGHASSPRCLCYRRPGRGASGQCPRLAPNWPRAPPQAVNCPGHIRVFFVFCFLIFLLSHLPIQK